MAFAWLEKAMAQARFAVLPPPEPVAENARREIPDGRITFKNVSGESIRIDIHSPQYYHDINDYPHYAEIFVSDSGVTYSARVEFQDYLFYAELMEKLVALIPAPPSHDESSALPGKQVFDNFMRGVPISADPAQEEGEPPALHLKGVSALYFGEDNVRYQSNLSPEQCEEMFVWLKEMASEVSLSESRPPEFIDMETPWVTPVGSIVIMNQNNEQIELEIWDNTSSRQDGRDGYGVNIYISDSGTIYRADFSLHEHLCVEMVERLKRLESATPEKFGLPMFPCGQAIDNFVHGVPIATPPSDGQGELLTAQLSGRSEHFITPEGVVIFEGDELTPHQSAEVLEWLKEVSPGKVTVKLLPHEPSGDDLLGVLPEADIVIKNKNNEQINIEIRAFGSPYSDYNASHYMVSITISDSGMTYVAWKHFDKPLYVELIQRLTGSESAR